MIMNYTKHIPVSLMFILDQASITNHREIFKKIIKGVTRVQNWFPKNDF